MRAHIARLGFPVAVGLIVLTVRPPADWTAAVDIAAPDDLSGEAQFARLEEFQIQFDAAQQQADAIADELIEGTIDFAAAVERVTAVNEFRSGKFVRSARYYWNLPDAGEQEIYAHYILVKVRRRPGFDRSAPNELAHHLKARFRELTGAADDPFDLSEPTSSGEQHPGRPKRLSQ